MNEITTNDNEFKTREFICVLHSWLNRCRDARDGHYKRAEKLYELSHILGYILTYSTVFVTVFSFITYDEKKTIFLGISQQHIVVLVGCIAAVISGIVSQARFGERSEMHRSSGARYANLAREIEALQIKMNADLVTDNELSLQADLIINEWNNLSEDSLLTPHNKTHPNYCFHLFITFSFIVMFFFVAT
ncbi:SLATT domain-containing protein [Photobacterium damselae subsp. damselae]|uniref:SLATT domain-containing protein n=1 Tax=Photobacterium damselae TaxID=38293 RepID=UPI000A3001DF|nr:SLATT domain-containing protein [Photobacterium damselae]ARR51346.1 hypothetical protein CAY62_18170 [Photobacterium damselae subsp. damselae]QAY36872.1 SLATT domain-containing protein [Photobacterium damselae subsp. damselae]